jgi:pimeloyl-ACP methyl ester carboxylesterase
MLPDLSRYEKFVKLTNGTMRYYELGQGENHTILSHGMGVYTSADTFQFILEALAEKLHVFAIDCIGFGKSTRSIPNGPNFDIIVDGIREFMDIVGIQRANYLGHSAGGWWGPLLAYQSPDRIRKLICMSSAGMDPKPVSGVSGYQAPTLESVRKYVAPAQFEGSALIPELAEEMVAQMLECANLDGAVDGLRPLVSQMTDPATRNHYLVTRRMPYLKMPVMFLWGKRDPKEPLPTWTAEWDQTGGDPSVGSKPWAPKGTRYVIMEGGPQMQWEKPKEVSEHILGFFSD